VARDRKRAKQRQQRRTGARSAAGRAAERDERASEHGPGPDSGRAPGGDGDSFAEGLVEGAPSHLTRGELPGSLDHVGDVDEFDAALVRGAGGVPVAPGTSEEDAALEAELEYESEHPAEAGAGAESEVGSGSEAEPKPTRKGRAAANGAPTAPVRVQPAARPAAPRQHLPGRALAFLRASWAELQRVQWPNRSQVTQATAVVLGFVAVAGIYFGIADYVAKEVVEAIL
jgi:preprotein translocase subunit SecE